jgi:multisubunit Na+/H+ antiporter MnhG subunit
MNNDDQSKIKRQAQLDTYSSIEPAFRKQTFGFISTMLGIFACWVFQGTLNKVELVILFMVVTIPTFLVLNKFLWLRK